MGKRFNAGGELMTLPALAAIGTGIWGAKKLTDTLAMVALGAFVFGFVSYTEPDVRQ